MGGQVEGLQDIRRPGRDGAVVGLGGLGGVGILRQGVLELGLPADEVSLRVGSRGERRKQDTRFRIRVSDFLLPLTVAGADTLAWPL